MLVQHDPHSLQNRPGIFIIGSCNVGKRTLVSRLISVDLSENADLPAQSLCYGWTIDTKYYTADVSVWISHIEEGFSYGKPTIPEQVAALVMVFDMNELSSLDLLKDWVTGIDLQKFEILLCIGNKVDLLPGHAAHREYRRRLQKQGESSSDPHPEYLDFGILETEGSSLLGNDDEPSWEISRSCLEWCSQNNIEYIEACASNVDFDKCLSVDGDLQGVERLYGALSAHMWPGMILKSGSGLSQPSPPKKDLSDEESDYEIEYEVLSRGSAGPWDDEWVAFNEAPQPSNAETGPSVNGSISLQSQNESKENINEVETQTSDSRSWLQDESVTEATEVFVREDPGVKLSGAPSLGESEVNTVTLLMQEASEGKTTESPSHEPKISRAPLQEESEMENAEAMRLGEDMHLGYEDLEKLMCEISLMHENSRLMPDIQRKEMAAKLAMKMATMFADSDDEDF